MSPIHTPPPPGGHSANLLQVVGVEVGLRHHAVDHREDESGRVLAGRGRPRHSRHRHCRHRRGMARQRRRPRRRQLHCGRRRRRRRGAARCDGRPDRLLHGGRVRLLQQPLLKRGHPHTHLLPLLLVYTLKVSSYSEATHTHIYCHCIWYTLSK